MNVYFADVLSVASWNNSFIRMWKLASNAIAGIRSKKNSTLSKQVFWACSDDEVCSEASRDEELECPICWESFNIVENIPYVLWCGHSLCKNCVLGLQGSVLKVASRQIRIPIFISCPWCHQLSLRVVYRGNLKFPSKNFFLRWMVESFNGNEGKLDHSFNGNNQPVFSLPSDTNTSERLSASDSRVSSHGIERRRLFFYKHLDCLVHLIFKFLLVAIFLLIVVFVIPGSALILLLYLLITLLFALPSLLIFYLAVHALEKLMSDITSWNVITMWFGEFQTIPSLSVGFYFFWPWRSNLDSYISVGGSLVWLFSLNEAVVKYHFGPSFETCFNSYLILVHVL